MSYCEVGSGGGLYFRSFIESKSCEVICNFFGSLFQVQGCPNVPFSICIILFCLTHNVRPHNSLLVFQILQLTYEFNASSGTFGPILSHVNENFSFNLSTLLQWSPYSTEEELLKQVSQQTFQNGMLHITMFQILTCMPKKHSMFRNYF